MAAIATLPSPVSRDKYVVFYNNSNNLLASVQQLVSDLGTPLYDFSTSSISDVPTGAIANPSSLASVLFQEQINTYGVLNGITAGDLLVCRLSPGFELLDVGNPPLSTPSSIAACSDGDEKGTLFFLVKSPDGVSQIKFITLPGTQSTSSPTGIALNLNPTTYLGAAYGSLGGKPVDSYVGLQTYQGDVGVCSRLNSLSAVISQVRGLKNTPIAMVFVGNHLVVYFFGLIGEGGNDPDASPVYRAVTKDLSSFNVATVSNAPSPNGYTQLAAFPNASSSKGSLGTVILSYVQKDSNQLVSWEDDLSDSGIQA